MTWLDTVVGLVLIALLCDNIALHQELSEMEELWRECTTAWHEATRKGDGNGE